MGSEQLSPVLQADWYLPQGKRRLATHPMCAEEIPLKRHTDTCPGISRSHSKGILILAVGFLHVTHVHPVCPLTRHTDTCHEIATYIARPFSVPTQKAYWYLPWDSYTLQASIQCAHSRGILTLSVGLLPILHAHSRGILILAMGLLLVLSPDPLYAPLKWHLRQFHGVSLKLSFL